MKINPQECHRTLIKSLVFVLLIVLTQTAMGKPAYTVLQNSGVRERVIEAESMMRFLESMKENKRADMVVAFKEGRERGGFPDWMSIIPVKVYILLHNGQAFRNYKKRDIK